MAMFTDSKDRQWEVRFSVPKLTQVTRKLKLKISDLMTMNVPIADLIDSVPILIEEQLKEKEISAPVFMDGLNGDDIIAIGAALTEALKDAFPKNKEVMEAVGPLDLGKFVTSLNSQPSPE